MSCKMNVLDNINVAREKLMEALGEKDQEYLQLMKKWFKMKFTKEEFDSETRQLMTPEQIHLHNQLILRLLNKCVNLSIEAAEEEDSYNTRKKYNCFQGNFEPLDSTYFTVTDRQEVLAEAPPYLIHEHLLPDQSFTLARFMYGAWELGLEGSTTSAADLLLSATYQFLKNVLTAIICWRKGYKLNGHFIHGLGDPLPNPWLKNVAQHEMEQSHCLKVDPSEDEILVPNERPTQEELDQETTFKLAASDFDDNNSPISTYDLIATLKMYPNLLASNFVLTVNSERIMAKICHPSWDD